MKKFLNSAAVDIFLTFMLAPAELLAVGRYLNVCSTISSSSSSSLTQEFYLIFDRSPPFPRFHILPRVTCVKASNKSKL